MNTSLSNRLRGLAKAGCALGMHYTHLDKVVGARRGLQEAPLVLGYHRVVQNFDRSDRLSISPMLTSVNTLEKHLDWIGKHYDFVSLDEFALILEGTRKQSRPVAAITFDDGYQDVYINAFPLLKRKGIPSTVFVVTDLVGTSRLLVHDELYLLLSTIMEQGEISETDQWRDVAATLRITTERRRRLCSKLNESNDPFRATRVVLETLSQSDIYEFIKSLKHRVFIAEEKWADFQILNWDMLREMVAGGMAVGSHTKSHALLANETPEVIQEEVEDSRRELERRLGVPVKHFAYPDGRFNTRVVQAVAAAGYRTACTICGHRDRRYPMLSIPRKMLWENACMDGFGHFSPAILSCQVNGIFDPADKCRLQHWV